MTTKIPVGATIERAYGFALRNFINNLGATWIPQAILLASGYFISPYYTATLRKMAGAPAILTNGQGGAAAGAAMAQNVQAFIAAGPYFALLTAISLVCTAAMVVGLTREALGIRKGSPFLQNPLGLATWRMIGAFILFVLLAIAVYVAFLMLTLSAALLPVTLAKGAPAMKAVAGIAAFVIILASLCAFFYIPVRAGFLIAPAVVAENRVTLGWRLTRGNFWRIVVVGIAILLPFIAMEIALLTTLTGAQLLPPMHPGVTPEETRAWSQQLNARLYAYADAFRAYWYVTYPVAVVVTTVLYGLVAGGSAFAYRALVGEKRDPSEAFS